MGTPGINAGLTLTDRLKHPQQQWSEAIRQNNFDLRVASPGIIQSFDPATQTCTVMIPIKENITVTSKGSNGVLQSTQQGMTIPVLQDVPVVLPRCNGFAVTLPIQAGDECLLIFCDAKIDWFWQSGNVSSTGGDPRRHDLSDAICIPTGISQPKVLSNYSTDSLQVRSVDGDTVVDVKEGQITLTAATVVVNASGTATIQAETINIEGSSAVNITGAGNTKIEGTQFTTHQHTGVTSGGSNTGPVLP